MQELTMEVLIGILILSLLSMAVIPLYNQVQMTVNNILYRTNAGEVEKCLFGLEEGMDYTGGEVIAQINYFSRYPDRIITVSNDEGTLSYIDSGYIEDEFMIQIHERYSFSKNSAPGYTEYIYIHNN